MGTPVVNKMMWCGPNNGAGFAKNSRINET